jgi:cystathionine beta-lyase
MTPSNDGPSYTPKPDWSPRAKGQKGFGNPAVFHGSTALDPTAEDLHAHGAEFAYGVTALRPRARCRT